MSTNKTNAPINDQPTPEAIARSEANSGSAEQSVDNVKKAQKSDITKDLPALRLELIRIIAPLGGNTNIVNRTDTILKYIIDGTVLPDT